MRGSPQWWPMIMRICGRLEPSYLCPVPWDQQLKCLLQRTGIKLITIFGAVPSVPCAVTCVNPHAVQDFSNVNLATKLSSTDEL